MRRTVILFLLGATLGTFGDWMHVMSHTLGYPNPIAPIPWTGQPFWVPFLFGFAVLSTGQAHLASRSFFCIPPREVPFSTVITGAIAFLVLYGLSGSLPHNIGNIRDLVLSIGALSIFIFFDRTIHGLMLGLITALIGTTVEILLTRLGVFSYSPYFQNLFGVPTWLPWLYLAASVAIGNFVWLLSRKKAEIKSSKSQITT